MNEQTRPAREAARIAVGYLVLSLLWVFVSDRLAAGLAGDDAALLGALQTWKGAFYMAVMALLLFFIVRRALERQLGSEVQLNALNVDLEHRVAERTAQLEAANRELESFSYSVSHDLKAPLRGVDGYSQILLLDHADQLDDEGRELIGNIRDGVAQMHGLIEDMLAYSRMERRSLDARVMALEPIARNVVEQRGNAAAAGDEAAAEADIVLALDADIAARIDRDGFALTLRNLLENAIKFSRGREPARIEIGAETRGDAVVLWVRDNGIGFDMQYHDRIFDIFQRLHRAEDYPGTGVGLALVRKAVSRMGGRVWAESEVGQGATFFVELPR